jgi:succinate dehydrogenase / fumarate reductase cytochrome b subunit
LFPSSAFEIAFQLRDWAKQMRPQRYGWHVGSFAWLLHRITGLFLAVYLFIHIWVVRTVSHGPDGFNKMMSAVQTPIFLLFEVGLLGTVLYHTLNGVRLLLIDAGWGVRYQKGLFFVLAGLGAFIFVVGVFPILDLLGKPVSMP